SDERGRLRAGLPNRRRAIEISRTRRRSNNILRARKSAEIAGSPERRKNTSTESSWASAIIPIAGRRPGYAATSRRCRDAKVEIPRSTWDRSPLEIAGQSQPGALETRGRRPKISIANSEMIARREARPAPQHPLVIHELAVVFP